MHSDEENKENASFRRKGPPFRAVIYPKDIQLLTGKSYRYALYLFKETREHFQKKDHQLLTIYEFADYTGIHPEVIISHLR